MRPGAGCLPMMIQGASRPDDEQMSRRPRSPWPWSEGMAVSRRERITKEVMVEPGTDANIAGRDPAWTGGPDFEQLSAKQLSRTAKELLAKGVKELSKA